MTAKQLMSLGAGLERMQSRLDDQNCNERWAYWLLTDAGWVKYVDTDEGRAE